MIRIGISGWTYPPWRRVFYPPELPQREELAYASRQVSSIEINGTFYALQSPTSYAKWHAETPDNFVFSVKAPRFITHIKRLKGGPALIANFFASGVLRLEEKLGPILWQLPPSLKFDPTVLDEFLGLLPRTTKEAAALARHHDGFLKSTWTKTLRDHPLRHALEVRHASFQNAEFVALLKKHRVAIVVADTAGKWPHIEDVTADFVYVRLHGDEELYASGYTPTALTRWSKHIQTWAEGGSSPQRRLVAPDLAKKSRKRRDIYVYFDNDVKIRAPYNARQLIHRLKLGPKPSLAPPASAISEKARTQWRT
jgi:uncharacterized protein YecE (DUF72 family)